MKLAVLIPAYNSRATLAETLRSLMDQSPQGRLSISRVVLADDGSTDQTADTAREVWNDPEIPLEVWRREENRGERHTVNEAFSRLLAEGDEWCAVLHADDLAKSAWMEQLISRVEQAAPDVVSICSSWDSMRHNQIIPGEDNPSRKDEKIVGHAESASGTLRKGCWWHFSGCMMNLRNFAGTNGFCEDMPQLGDLEWLVRALRGGLSVVYVPRTLIFYRENEGNVSSVSFKTNRDFREALLICERHGHDSDLRPAVASYTIATMRRAFRRAVTSVLRGDIMRGAGSLRLFGKLARAASRLR